MARLDHLGLTVANLAASRAWYTSVLGLEVEFDTGSAVGLKDESDFTLILTHQSGHISECNLFFQVEDVDASYREMRASGYRFSPSAAGQRLGLRGRSQ
jgi:catechol 2,3-dioxygenase-like lactoylglutathione lyase family enzyme